MATSIETPQAFENDTADSHQPCIPPSSNYQDKEESREARLKAILDTQMGGMVEAIVSYQKAAVLLLSWDKTVDDLHTEEEVCCKGNIEASNANQIR